MSMYYYWVSIWTHSIDELLMTSYVSQNYEQLYFESPIRTIKC
uniref:Uncharacterized protein n=1 Tax=Lepeophtheirus salmonis TaxID=72036 RepID=A0A0K2T438_LEPSM